MRNIWRIFRDDIRRLAANTMSIVITIGLVVLPSLFSWYNILACWDVFGNTGNLKVAVANADAGYESDLIALPVNVGEQVMSALRANDQIDWVFTDEEDAVDGARAGRYYAAVVIPESFSRDMLTFYASDAEPAHIAYYSNEKKNAIAPKVTDQGADAISYEINETFAEVLSKTALAIAESIARTADSGDASSALATIADRMGSAADRLDETASTLETYVTLSYSLQDLAGQSAALAASAHERLSNAMDAGGDAVADVSGVADDLLEGVDGLMGSLDHAERGFSDLATKLEGMDLDVAKGSDSANASDASASNAKSTVSLDELGQLRDEAVSRAHAAAREVADVRERIELNVRTPLASVSSDASDLANRIADLSASLGSAADRLDKISATAQSALGSVRGSIESSVSGMRASAQQIRDLSASIVEALAEGDSSQLRAVFGADVQTLSRAIAAPVALDRVAIYPVENFGSAMTPLYAALALFIGSLLIMVAMKPTVPEAEFSRLDDPKPRELFLGRFGVIGAVSLLQATVMGLGCLLFLQVQAVHPLLFMTCFWVAGLVFSFIVYALVAAFANLGKALSVLLLIVQVTGCGGSYPLVIMPSFVQAVSPYLPATHVVNAMRAAMMGVYGNDFLVSIGLIAAFVVPAAIIGLALRRPLARFMRWFVEHAEASKLIG